MPDRYRFDEFTFDPLSGDLHREPAPGGVTSTTLRPQVAQVLEMFCRRPGEVLPREEIQAEIWQQPFVDPDQGLNHCIRELRRELGDSAQQPRFVETLPRRGYRLLVAVRSTEDSTPTSHRPSESGPAEAGLEEAALAEATSADAARVSASLRNIRAWARVAAACLLALLVDGMPGDRPGLLKPPLGEEIFAAAREARLAGDHLMARGGAEDPARAAHFFRRAISLDPSRVDAWTGLVRALLNQQDRSPAARAEALAGALQAVHLAPADPLAHQRLGDVRFVYRGEWEEAEVAYREALRLDPDRVATRLHLAQLYSVRGRDGEMLRELERATAIDPVFTAAAGSSPRLLLDSGRPVAALEEAERAVSFDGPGAFAGAALEVQVLAHAQLGELDGALEAASAVLARRGLDPALPDSDLQTMLDAYHRRRLDALQAPGACPVEKALLHAALGQHDAALGSLAEPARDRSRALLFQLRDPRFEALRDDPRFTALVSAWALEPPSATPTGRDRRRRDPLAARRPLERTRAAARGLFRSPFQSLVQVPEAGRFGPQGQVESLTKHDVSAVGSDHGITVSFTRSSEQAGRLVP